MKEYNYAVSNEIGQIIAVFANLEDALIFIKASFEKYFAEPLEYKIVRFDVNDLTSIQNVYKEKDE